MLDAKMENQTKSLTYNLLELMEIVADFLVSSKQEIVADFLVSSKQEIVADFLVSSKQEIVAVFLVSPKQATEIHFDQSQLYRQYVRLHKYSFVRFVEEYQMILML